MWRRSHFEGNVLTRDPAMFQMMKDQLAAHPELALAAPSTIWLREALDECAWLMEQTAPEHALPDLPWQPRTDRGSQSHPRPHGELAQWHLWLKSRMVSMKC